MAHLLGRGWCNGRARLRGQQAGRGSEPSPSPQRPKCRLAGQQVVAGRGACSSRLHAALDDTEPRLTLPHAGGKQSAKHLNSDRIRDAHLAAILAQPDTSSGALLDSDDDDEQPSTSGHDAFSLRGALGAALNAGPSGGVGGRAAPGRQALRQQALERLLAQRQHLDHLDGQLSSLISGLLGAPHRWGRHAARNEAGAPAAPQLPTLVLQDLPNMTAPGAAKLFADLGRGGSLSAALQLLEAVAAAGRSDILARIAHKHFLRPAADAGAVREALRYVTVMPPQYMDARCWNMVLSVCAAAGDLAAANTVLDAMRSQGHVIDFIHQSTLIMVAARSGDTATAFKHYADVKAAAASNTQRPGSAGSTSSGSRRFQQAASGQIDGQVFGCMVAACVRGIMGAQGNRKEQLVLLERAFGVVQDALSMHVPLDAAVWNALLACAARSNQLERSFEVLDMMQSHGSDPDVFTYGTLVEACTSASEPEMALRVYRKALMDGLTGSVQLYTAAVNACMLHGDWETAAEIYTTMQRHDVEPDDLLYGNLIALMGQARRLDEAFALVEDLWAGGLVPGMATASALIHACLCNENLPAARKVYDTLSARGVHPHISQYNALMEQYALAFRLGDVVALLAEMVGHAGHAPNPNTFRILLLAAVRADQPELAYEVYYRMKAQGLPIKGPYAQAICFTLMKGCFNHIRSTWSPNGYPPKRLDAATSAAGVTGAAAGGGAAASAAALHRVVAGRQQPSLLARKLLAVLQPPRSKPQRFTFLDNSENINWVALAAATYRDLQAQGVRPSLSVLDMLLSCLRLPLDSSGAAQRHAASTAAAPPLQELAATNGAAGPAATGAAPAQGQAAEAAAHTLGVDDAWADFEDGQADSAAAVTAQLLQDLRREMDLMRAEERPYEQAFDRRALDAVADAVSQGMLPVYKTDEPFTMDMRQLPPSVAEVYVLSMLTNLEQRRAANARISFHHPIKLLVPPFDPNYIMWPSYVEKLNLHYDDQLRARQEVLRQEAETAREEAARKARARGPVVSMDSSLEDDEGEALYDDGRLTQQQQRRRNGRFGGSWESYDTYDEEEARSSVATTAGCDYWEAGEVTGLGVAATLYRAKAYARIDAPAGELVMTAREINRWVGRKLVNARAAELAAGTRGVSGEVPPPAAPHAVVGAPVPGRAPGLADQTRSIRLGMQMGVPPRTAPGGLPGTGRAAGGDSYSFGQPSAPAAQRPQVRGPQAGPSSSPAASDAPDAQAHSGARADVQHAPAADGAAAEQAGGMGAAAAERQRVQPPAPPQPSSPPAGPQD